MLNHLGHPQRSLCPSRARYNYQSPSKDKSRSAAPMRRPLCSNNLLSSLSSNRKSWRYICRRSFAGNSNPPFDLKKIYSRNLDVTRFSLHNFSIVSCSIEYLCTISHRGSVRSRRNRDTDNCPPNCDIARFDRGQN